MIKIEILKSNDDIMVGEHHFKTNFLLLSNRTGHLIIDDPFFSKGDILFQVSHDGLFLNHTEELDYILINGKRQGGKIPLNKNDQLGRENFFLKIIDFEQSEDDDLREDWKKKLAEVKDPSHPQNTLFQMIESEFPSKD